MNNYLKQIDQDLYYLGQSDRKIRYFENYIPLSEGMSYNAYLLIDEKTCLFDTVDFSVSREFLEDLKETLSGRELDYVVVHHMEPDHCATLEEVLLRYPEVTVITNLQVFKMISQFFPHIEIKNKLVVKEGAKVNFGKNNLTFIQAPMVHWPEVMVSYLEEKQILFSADAFGSFGALSGDILISEMDDINYESEMRRYYTNIVGKYGPFVLKLLGKASQITIKKTLPLHGYIIDQDLEKYIAKYVKWASYEPEENNAIIVYSSMYGNTAKAAQILARTLSNKGLKRVKVYDASLTDKTYLISETFKVKQICILSPSYNQALHPKLEEYVHALETLEVQNRTYTLIENGTWSPNSNKVLKERLENLKGTKILAETLSIKSNLTDENKTRITEIADAIINELKKGE